MAPELETPAQVDIGAVQVRLPRSREARLQDARGPRRGRRARDLGAQERAAVDARLPPQGATRSSAPSRCRPGAANLSGIDFENDLLLPEAGRAERALLGRRPRGHQEHVRAARHPRGRAQVPGRRRRAVRVRGHLPQPQEGARGPAASSSSTRTRRSQQHEELFREYWATVIPATDNKFAALNSAVWSGGSFIYVPPGVQASSSRCRPTSASTPRTWASSSGR